MRLVLVALFFFCSCAMPVYQSTGVCIDSMTVGGSGGQSHYSFISEKGRERYYSGEVSLNIDLTSAICAEVLLNRESDFAVVEELD